jgi:hypothetical protein
MGKTVLVSGILLPTQEMLQVVPSQSEVPVRRREIDRTPGAKYTGKPHWRCGTTLKYVSTGTCVECGQKKSQKQEQVRLNKERVKKMKKLEVILQEAY